MTLSLNPKHCNAALICVAPIAAAVLAVLIAGCASIPAEQPEKTITSIAFSPDQKLLAMANAYEINVTDAVSWKSVRTLRKLPQNSASAQPQLFRHGVGDNLVFLDNDRIVSTGMGGLVTIWDARSGIELASIQSLPEDVFATTIDYSDAGKRLAIGTSDGRILLADLNSHQIEPPVALVNAIGPVWDLQFSRDGKYLASASQMPVSSAPEEATGDPYEDTAESWANTHSRESRAPPNVVIWDVENLAKVGELEGANYVFRMELVPGQPALLTVGASVDVWTFLDQEQLEEISDPSMVAQGIMVGTFAVVSVASLSMGGLPNFSVGESLFNLAHFPVIPTAASMRQVCARAAAISPDGQTIVSTKRGPSHNVMAVIDRTRNKVIEKWTSAPATCDLEFSQDGKYLVAATSGGVYRFDTTSWKKTEL